MRFRLHPGALIAGFAALPLLVLALLASSSASAFTPITQVCLDDTITIDPDFFASGDPGECDGDNAASAPSGVTLSFDSSLPGGVTDELVFFIPPGWQIPGDAAFTDGAVVGNLLFDLNIGIGSNGYCNLDANLRFALRDATTNQSQLVSFDDQDNIVSGIPRGALEYPEYLLETWVASPGNAATALQPAARYFGRPVASLPFQMSLNVGVFPPGMTYRGTSFSPQLGIPVVVTPQITGQWDEYGEPGRIYADCSPHHLSLTIENGVWANPPAAGAFSFTTFAIGQPDADGDGQANGLDPCPFLVTPGWEPDVQFAGDADDDGLPNACDPLPNDPGNPADGALQDHDGDSYHNRQDNCPLVINNLGLPLINPGGPDNQGDNDFDDIGNACDINPNTGDGERSLACGVSVIEIGPGGPPAIDPAGLTPCSNGITTYNCHNCGDADSDGIANAFDNCPDAPNPDQADNDDDGIGDACEAVGGVVEIVAGSREGSLAGVLLVVALVLAGVALPRRRTL